MTININRAIIINLCVLLIGVALPLTALALAPPPPPTPPPPATATPKPTSVPQPSQARPAAGATIELLVQPTSETVWQTYFWQDLWTVVQWWGLLGIWYDVTGWQGNLNQIVDGAGQKTWWVDETNFSKGPFRWALYQNQGGPLLSTSESFHLPDSSGDKVTVEIELGP